VLAHEYGHFSNQDTAGGNLALATRVRLIQMGRALIEGGAATVYNPAWWFFRAYLWAFLRISQGASRLQEILADRFAVFAFGSAAFEEGYTHVIRQSVRFDAHAETSLKEVIEAKKALANLYRFVPETPVSEEQLEKALEQALSREPSPFDSHPSSRDRLEWARALAIPSASAAEDAQEVWSLFDEREPLERQMTQVIRRQLGENQGVFIPDTAT
jgi:Zn-dependent protease with chaperone function